MIEITVRARRPDFVDARTIIIVKLPNVDYERDLSFRKKLYLGSLNEEFQLELDVMIFDDRLVQDVEMQLSGVHADKFELIKDGNQISLRQRNAGITITDSLIILSVEIFKSGFRTGQTNIVITTTKIAIGNLMAFEQ